MFSSTPDAALWRAGDMLFTQPWKTTAAALIRLRDHLQSKRRDAGVGCLSGDWLRRHEIEAAKHREDV